MSLNFCGGRGKGTKILSKAKGTLELVIFLGSEVEWDDASIEQELRVRSEDLLGLQKELFELMTKFGLRAIKKFQGMRSDPLSPVQMSQIVTTQIQFLLETLSDQTFIDMVTEKAKRESAKSGSEPTTGPCC